MTSNKEKPITPTQNFQILRLYVKEQIFKIPNVPHVFADEWKPEISMEMQIKNNLLQDNHHEVFLI